MKDQAFGLNEKLIDFENIYFVKRNEKNKVIHNSLILFNLVK